MGPWMNSQGFTIDRRAEVRLTPIEPCPHFHCPNCPFEGDEEAMIAHAMDCGHIALMVDEGCPLC